MRAVAVLAVLALAALPLAGAAENLSAPNKIPDLYDFRTPQIVPGEKGTYQFSLRNRYEGTMTNASLTIEIYKWATLEEAKDVGRVSDPPRMEGGLGQKYDAPAFTLGANQTSVFRVTMATGKGTAQGTYFVRQMLQFDYNGTHLLMKSRGYFTSKEWENATTSANGSRAVGGINLTALGVDGILPDSSFGVKEPIPLWPLALLIGLTAFFGALALVFYLLEEKGHFSLKKRFYEGAGKLEQARRLSEQELRKLRRGVKVPPRRDEPE